MKLSKIAKKPQLIKVELDDEEVIKQFGESLEFWTWDRQPMEVFLQLSSVTGEDQRQVIETVRKLILDENGEPILMGEEIIPTGILLKVITKVVEGLGKL
jgi:hypothetical protein